MILLSWSNLPVKEYTAAISLLLKLIEVQNINRKRKKKIIEDNKINENNKKINGDNNKVLL